jgi:antitoxin component HigA of HigAB toxin-antitoxin module
MTVQIIRTPKGEELVLLSRAEYEALIHAAEEAYEDASDVAAYDAAMADLEGLKPMPAEVTRLHLDGNSLLKALRLWRKKGQVELAKEIGTSQGFVSDLENRRRTLTPDVARKLAAALDVPERWLPD